MITESDAITLVSRSCALLDDEKFDDYLNLFAADGHYRITTYSPDLRRELIYLDLDRADLAALLQNVPRHVRMSGRLMRHPNGFLVDSKDDESSVMTSLLVIHTDLEGNSRIFAAGRYRDQLTLVDGKPAIKSREVRLDTRQFGPGSHVPL
jgi:methanesulfonate monooxygenase small subunit